MASAHDGSVPDWANFFNAEEYAAFIAALDDYFTSHQVSYELVNGVVHLDENFLGSGHLGVQNLAQHCKGSELSDYGSVISGYFEFVREGFAFNLEFAKIAHDFSKVQQYISVRVYDDAYMENIGKENAIGRDVAEACSPWWFLTCRKQCKALVKNISRAGEKLTRSYLSLA